MVEGRILASAGKRSLPPRHERLGRSRRGCIRPAGRGGAGVPRPSSLRRFPRFLLPSPARRGSSPAAERCLLPSGIALTLGVQALLIAAVELTTTAIVLSLDLALFALI